MKISDMYYVYVLRLANDAPYIGSTPDLKRRLNEHREGKSHSTRNYLPLALVAYFALQDRITARRFEEYLKSGSGRAFRRRHFEI